MAKPAPRRLLLLLLSSFFFVFFTTLFASSSSANTLETGGSVRDGETLVSADGAYQLGFFSPGGSTGRYLCIRLSMGPDKPIVWVANRERPLNNSAGVLKFGGDGNLVVIDKARGIVWSTKLALNTTSGRVARLLETGNLVVRDASGDAPGVFLWQSFDEPGNTLLPGMKLVLNTKTGATRRLTSWKSADDPSPGKYSYGLERNILPRLVLREGPTMMFTNGPWNGARFSGSPGMNANGVFNTSVVASGDELQYADTVIGNSSWVRAVLSPSGELQRLEWEEGMGAWDMLWASPGLCEPFAQCGPYGACAPGGASAVCQCLTGFWMSPKSRQCVRQAALGCSGGGGEFLRVQHVKLPELLKDSMVSMEMSLEECRDSCARNCSCIAYANADVREGGRGCITWSGDLVDIRNYSAYGYGQDFYLRVATSQPDDGRANSDKKKKKKLLLLLVVPGVIAAAILLVCSVKFYFQRRNSQHKEERQADQDLLFLEIGDKGVKEYGEFFRLDFEKVAAVTGNFSDENKLGEGGFGPVYKGMLPEGQEIAVKRLSRRSGQGMKEFKTEILLIAKLQHRNLVRLLGCCIKGEEKMLIYEYMPNKSLDFFLFNPTRAIQLDWAKRFHIIEGIAQGLLYLHKHSRLRIIHRDLKASNILLDSEMNPKISDFGMARIFSSNNSEANTNRVVGTYGYMSPEYAMEGLFSVKSDVFSFGVLLLEIVSGKRNAAINNFNSTSINLLGYAWKLWEQGRELELIDTTLGDSCAKAEVSRCIHVALLCVQEAAADRPTTSDIIAVLGNENASLPPPKQPAFFTGRKTAEEDSNPEQSTSISVNHVTISEVDGR